MGDITKKNWGYEELIYNGEYCQKLLVYEKPIASSLHYHPKKHECFYVSIGMFELDNGDGTIQRLGAGDSVVIPPGTKHRVRCVRPGVIVESSSHDDPSDCVRLVPSET